jgi:excisionase family DNA binding protein
MARHRPNWRLVKLHRNYEIAEAAKLLGYSRLTVRRWIKDDLPAIKDKRPILIVGEDLVNFLRARNKVKSPLRLNELYCFKCRCARLPAGDMLECVLRGTKGHITGLCAECLTVMHKAISASKVHELRRIAEVSFPQGAPHINETTDPIVNDHLRQEPMS